MQDFAFSLIYRLRRICLTPRGMRLCNPFNLRKTQIDWKGEVEGIDPDYETFKDFASGLRAGFRVLLTYFHKHHLNSVAEIISRFAPPPENNTAGYVQFVARRLAVDVQDHLTTDDNTLLNLAKAIITFEQGQQIFTDKELQEALNAARK